MCFWGVFCVVVFFFDRWSRGTPILHCTAFPALAPITHPNHSPQSLTPIAHRNHSPQSLTPTTPPHNTPTPFHSGSGRLYFYDVRAQRYFNHLDCGVDTTPDTTSSMDDYYTRGSGLPFHIKTGQGWLDHNSTYRCVGQGGGAAGGCWCALCIML